MDENVACSVEALTASTRNDGPTDVSSATSSHDSGAWVAWPADAGSTPRRAKASGSTAMAAYTSSRAGATNPRVSTCAPP